MYVNPRRRSWITRLSAIVAGSLGASLLTSGAFALECPPNTQLRKCQNVIQCIPFSMVRECAWQPSDDVPSAGSLPGRTATRTAANNPTPPTPPSLPSQPPPQPPQPPQPPPPPQPPQPPPDPETEGARNRTGKPANQARRKHRTERIIGIERRDAFGRVKRAVSGKRRGSVTGKDLIGGNRQKGLSGLIGRASRAERRGRLGGNGRKSGVGRAGRDGVAGITGHSLGIGKGAGREGKR